jgi:hypothetical protein
MDDNAGDRAHIQRRASTCRSADLTKRGHDLLKQDARSTGDGRNTSPVSSANLHWASTSKVQLVDSSSCRPPVHVTVFNKLESKHAH